MLSHLDSLLGAANPAKTGKRLDTLSTNLTQLTGRLADATGSLKGLLDKMDKGEGTLGKMATDTLLYKNLNATLKSLSELLTDLKERHGRYLTLKVFYARSPHRPPRQNNTDHTEHTLPPPLDP